MQIGSITPENNIFIAPLAGITDLPYRLILKQMGAAVLYTEMVSAKALCYGDKKTAGLMEISPEESPVAVQIFGSEPDFMAEAARIVEATTNASFIDINMGCPVPKVAGNGDGSGLLRDVELLGKVASAVVGAVKLPVTAKIRSGWDSSSINAVTVAKTLEASGISAIAVHGRTREMYYSGKADRKIIAEVKSAVKIPVIGNGDIFSPEDYTAMISETGCDAVMLARGILGNPWLVKQCCELASCGKVQTYPDINDVANMAVYHTRQLILHKGEIRGIKEARTHLTHYVKGYRGAARVKEKLTRAISIEEIENILRRWINNEICD